MKVKLIAITLAAVVALTGLWYVALWSPQGDKIDKAEAEQAVAEARSAELATRLARLKKLEENKDQLDAERALFATLIPDSDELDTFLLDIHAKAQASGIDFMSIAPAQPAAAGAPAGAAAGGAVPVGLNMQASGDYFALLRFLEQVRDGERLVTIDNLTMSGGEGGNLTASISGRMFIRGATPAPAPVAADPSAAAPATEGA